MVHDQVLGLAREVDANPKRSSLREHGEIQGNATA